MPTTQLMWLILSYVLTATLGAFLGGWWATDNAARYMMQLFTKEEIEKAYARKQEARGPDS